MASKVATTAAEVAVTELVPSVAQRPRFLLNQASGNADRPFSVNGDTFVNEAAAKQRSCDIQNNACMDAFNKGNSGFTVADCQAQQTACNA